MSSKLKVPEPSADWQCDFEGNEKFQMRYFRSLSIEDKFKAVEEMCEVVDFFQGRAARRRETK